MAWKKRTAPSISKSPAIEEVLPPSEPHIDPLAEEPAGSRHVGDPQLRAAVTRAVRLANDRQDPRANQARSW